MISSDILSESQNMATLPRYLKWLRWSFGICIGLGPLAFLAYAILNPAIRGTGSEVIAANIAANQLTNQLHLVFGVLASFMLPFGYVGMALLAIPNTPKLGAVALVLSLPSWIPLSALIGLDALTYDMGQLGGGAAFAELWNRFSQDGVMSTYLITYAFCHLLCTILLGIGLEKPHIIPKWAAWALIISSPLTIVGFVTHLTILLELVLVLLTLGSLPAALAMVKSPGKRNV